MQYSISIGRLFVYVLQQTTSIQSTIHILTCLGYNHGLCVNIGLYKTFTAPGLASTSTTAHDHKLGTESESMVSLSFLLVSLCLMRDIFAQGGLDIAAFNIQIFGRAKMDKPLVVDVLVQIINRYDIILVQEIRDSSGESIEQLVEEVNKVADDPYVYVIGSRVGRTTSKEQYAFIYRSDKVEVIDSYEYDDGNELSGDDLFEREPFIVRFHSKETLVKDFVIVGIHTKPTEAVSEIDSLVDVYDDILNRWTTDDVLMAGDMNADCSYVPANRWPTIRLRTDDRFEWLIDDGVDTTTSNTDCAYDRFVAAGDELNNGIRNGSVKVFDFDEAYGLSDDLMMDVSDHFPIELELLPDLNLKKVVTTPPDSGYLATMCMYPTMHLITFAAVIFNYYNC